MLRITPIKNSKNVNKPFRSPFDNVNKTNDKITAGSTPVKKSFEAKKILLLDQDENKQSSNSSLKNLTPGKKDNDTKIIVSEKRKSTDLSKINEPSKKRKQETTVNHQKNDINLENSPKIQINALKRRIFEKKQELESLKSRQLCAQKHNPNELKNSINKWKTACQEALGDLCYELNQRNNDVNIMKISDVLQKLGIPKELVGYSEEDDTFN